MSQLREEDVLSAEILDAVDDLRAADCCLPERKIEDVMETERNQRALDDTKSERSEITGVRHRRAERVDAETDIRPHEIHQDTDKCVRDRRDDRNEAAAAEE